MHIRDLFPPALLLAVLLTPCMGCCVGAATPAEESAFNNDPLYATCVESADEAGLCGVGRTLYVCSSLPSELTHECGSAEDSAPPLVLPMSLICCPTPTAATN